MHPLQDNFDRIAAMMEWQPIGTAPKDGTHCLFVRRDGKMAVDWWDKEHCTDRFWKEYGDREYRYTHWMSLPASPISSKERETE